LTAPANRLLSTYREGSDVELTYGDVLQSLCVRIGLSQIYFLQSQFKKVK